MPFDAFMQMDGIKGDSTDDKHKGWIEIDEFHHSITQPTGGKGSAQGVHAGGRADHADFTVLKRIDSGSPALMLHVCDGKPIPVITIECCRAMGEKTVFMKYTFKENIVAGVQASGDSDGDDVVPMETVTIRYGEIHVEYTPTDPKGGGKTGAAEKSAWSVLENKPL